MYIYICIYHPAHIHIFTDTYIPANIHDSERNIHSVFDFLDTDLHTHIHMCVHTYSERNILLVFDFLETDLHTIIHSKDPTKSPYVPLPDEDAKSYMRMLLSGVEACHKRNMMHRDIKVCSCIGVDEHT
jgi:serine/threonine protein kinase